MKLGAGIFLGLLLGLIAADRSPSRNDGKTATCTEEAPWLMGKKYLCTPAEAAKLQQPTSKDAPT